MSVRRIAGILIGCIGLAAGIVAVATSTAWLGLVGGVAALVCGLMSFGAVASSTDLEERAGSAALEVAELRRDLESARQNLSEERRQHDAARQSLADFLAAQPPVAAYDPRVVPEDVVGSSPEVDLDDEPANSADPRLLADPETSLFSEAYFRVALDARIASARRHLRPVAVALLEVVEGPGLPGATEADATKVTGSIRQTLRDADTACRMTDGCFALILEDTPENGAVWTVERIRRNLTSRFGQHTMWAGVACYPAHAFSTDELLDQASLALESAREWNQDRIEVATAD